MNKIEEMKRIIKSINDQVKIFKKCIKCRKRQTLIEYDYCSNCLDAMQFENE